MIPVTPDIAAELRLLLDDATESNFDSIRRELCQVRFHAEKVGLGLALLDSEDSEIKLKGQRFSIAHIKKLCSNPIQSVSNDQIHEIIVFLHQSAGLSKHMDTLNNVISLLKVTLERPFFAPVPYRERDSQSANPSRHLEMYFGSIDDNFESLLSEIGKEIALADIVTELGYRCTVDNAHCKEILSIFEPLDDVAISKLLGAVVGTHNGLGEAQNTHATFVSAIRNSHTSDSPQLTKWNTDVLVDSINELAPRTNWVRVMEYLDHDGFNIPDEAAFYLLMSMYARACKDPFPLHAVCGSLWKNTEGQISFLKHAVSAPTDTFTFAHSSRNLAFPDLAGPSQGNHAWFCLDLIEVLCQLAEVGYTVSVRSMLKYPLGHYPELLLLGVSHINTVYNLLQYEVLSCVFPAVLKDTTKGNLLNYLWHANPYLTLRGFVDAHCDPDCLLRIVDVCHDLKILSAVLDSTPFAFSIKLAAAASRKDYIHLEKWLTGKLYVCRKGFLEECVNFLKGIMSNADYILVATTQQPQAIVTNIYWESCPVFIKVLQTHSGHLLSGELLYELRKLYALYESRNPSSVVRELANSEGGSDDIEVEASASFQQMFSGQISIDSMIQILGRFKESSDKRKVSIFNCMISNLFEEYKFFPKYPDKQLKIAAVLFVVALNLKTATTTCGFIAPDFVPGSLIKHQLVAHLALGIALRGVLDALHKSVDSKMFMFGTTALEQFMDRVIEWPQYCNHILQISHIHGTHSEMVSALERALAKISSSQNEPNVGNLLSVEQHVSGSSSIEGVEATAAASLLASPHQSTITQLCLFFLGLPRQLSYTSGFGAALNIETLVAAAEQKETPIEVGFTPPSEVQDKILFMINNISNSNMEAKAKEFNEVVQEQYYPWFAQYMVMKRASIEPNFHDLYLKFFDKVNSKSSNKEILKATYENCKAAGWESSPLNQALRAKEIDPKALIVEYAAPVRLPPTSTVQDDKVALMISEQVPSLTQVSPAQTQSPSPSLFSVNQLMAAIPRDEIRFKINPKLGSLGPQLQYSKIMDLALDKANREIILTVIQRSVTIAIRTTKELILMDYALESDNNTITRSAHLMVRTLAGSLAHVTCKEPLRVALYSHLRNLIQNLMSGSETIEQLIHMLVNDNLDLGCAIIESVATRQAVEVIDGEMAQSFSQQRKQREAAGPAYDNTYAQGPFARVPEALRPKPGHLSVAQQRVYEDFVHVWHGHSQNVGATGSGPSGGATISSTLGVPGAYSPNPMSATSSKFSTVQMGSLTSITQSLEQVFDESIPGIAQFSSVALAQVGASDSSVLLGGTIGAASTVSPLASNNPHVGGTTVTTNEISAMVLPLSTTAADHLDLFYLNLEYRGCFGEIPTGCPKGTEILDRPCHRDSLLEALIANDGKDVEIQSVIAEVPDILLRCVSRDEAASAVAQKVIYSDEEKKFNIEIIFGLIRSKLLNLGEYNVHLAKLIDGGRNKVATEFAMSLVQTLIAQDSVSISELYNVVDALSKLARRPGSPEPLQQLIDTAKNNVNTITGFVVGKDEKVKLSKDKKVPATRANKEESTANEITLVDPNQVAVLFSEWCQMCDHLSASDMAYGRFVTQLHQEGLLKGDDISECFFCILTELAVTHSLVSGQIIAPGGSSQQSPQQPQISYFSIDSYAKLVVMVLKYSSVEISQNKGNILSKILSVTVRIIQKDAEEKKASFNPQPYFRLFINWLYDLTTDVHHEFQVLTAFANIFHHLQPLRFPAWSFCDVVPSSCIQMRNVILSAFPRNMRLPDPSTPNLKLHESCQIKSKQLKTEVDEYLKRPEGSSFLSDLKQKLLLPQNEATVAGTRYNVPLINSLVLYVGIQAVQQLQLNKANASASVQQINHTPLMDIFQIETASEMFKNLITSLDTEGRYLLLNAIANQLRYPNNHTHYFSFIILYLFAEATQVLQDVPCMIPRVSLLYWTLLIFCIMCLSDPLCNNLCTLLHIPM
ncbi:CCR4-NOT transcription complex subunit 1 [Dichanthelium oligosanthes]|uniref:CCR4-NOT transcription complex subunit 1 n=1 Tax=Dichanthelium oligosanthes TaxID=888268 RepID=A0A1E5VPH8_9POAL|nr:CCR4-NOT transcription complex subunit 1 [Dichanthelium oligosanthes]